MTAGEMMKRLLLLLALGLGAQIGWARDQAPEGARRTELIRLVREDCGSCHGLTLEGGLGPPLLPATMNQRNAADIRNVILDGLPGTPMPPWARFLTTGEAQWIATELQKGFPDEVR
jgi:cytochrome c55X